MFFTRLKELRARKGISQAELARCIGMSQQAIAKWETEKATPDPEMLKIIADFFNVSTDYLIGRTFEPNSIGLNISSEDLDILTKIKNLPPDRREIVDTIIKINEKEKELAGERACGDN